MLDFFHPNVIIQITAKQKKPIYTNEDLLSLPLYMVKNLNKGKNSDSGTVQYLLLGDLGEVSE